MGLLKGRLPQAEIVPRSHAIQIQIQIDLCLTDKHFHFIQFADVAFLSHISSLPELQYRFGVSVAMDLPKCLSEFTHLMLLWAVWDTTAQTTH